MVRSTVRLALMAAACTLLAGCAHKVKVAPPPPLPPAVTVPLVSAPEPASPPQVQKQPVPTVPLPTASVQPKPKRSRKKAAVPDPAPVVAGNTTPPPGLLAATGGPPPAASVIGALTAGGDAAPAEKQHAADSIAAVEKSLAGFPGSGSDEQREGLMRVRNFIRQAHEALNTGDAEGASTLATKAKVLLDDLMK